MIDMAFSGQDAFLYLVIASMISFVIVVGFVSITERGQVPPQ
jgi:hypothetical protein